MSAARLQMQNDVLAPAEELHSSPADDNTSALKDQVAQRLAEHRARRTRADAAPAPQTPAAPAPARSRSAEIAAAVARRYAESPTYRAVLAAESARSIREAEAAAEIANINARAIARAQHELLEQLGGWGAEPAPLQPASTVPLAGPLPAPEPARAAAAIIAGQLAQKQQRFIPQDAPPAEPAPRVAAAARLESELFAREESPARATTPSLTEVSRSGLTVRLFDEVALPSSPSASNRLAPVLDEQEGLLLDEEIRFRNDPTFDDTRAPEPLPANLIEFPRQLVAARKARPRFAEGPLRADAPETDPTQLRIFEVESDLIALAPNFTATAAAAPEWSSILLPAQPATTFFDPLDSDYVPALVPQTAPISRRVMASLLDLSLIGIGTLASIAVFTVTATFLTKEPIAEPRLIVGAAAVLALILFSALYHLLFFTFADSTPGMRYARIAFCTFSDENPSRRAMRRRLWAMALSLIPLGIGYLWALLDEDRLGWHDRISRMYQRAY